MSRPYRLLFREGVAVSSHEVPQLPEARWWDSGTAGPAVDGPATAWIPVGYDWSRLHSPDGEAVPSALVPQLQKTLLPLASLGPRLGTSLEISGGYFSLAYLSVFGGEEDPPHYFGQALDLRSPTLTPRSLYARLEEFIRTGDLPEGGLACRENHVHYDCRGYKARWDH